MHTEISSAVIFCRRTCNRTLWSTWTSLSSSTCAPCMTLRGPQVQRTSVDFLLGLAKSHQMTLILTAPVSDCPVRYNESGMMFLISPPLFQNRATLKSINSHTYSHFATVDRSLYVDFVVQVFAISDNFMVNIMLEAIPRTNLTICCLWTLRTKFLSVDHNYSLHDSFYRRTWQAKTSLALHTCHIVRVQRPYKLEP